MEKTLNKSKKNGTGCVDRELFVGGTDYFICSFIYSKNSSLSKMWFV